MAILRCVCLQHTEEECDKANPATDYDEGPSGVRLLLPQGMACQEAAVLGAGAKMSGPVLPMGELCIGSATEEWGPGGDQLELLAVHIRCDESATSNMIYRMSTVRPLSTMVRLHSCMVCRS